MSIDYQNNKVHHDVLEADDHGITPRMPGFNAECISCIQLVSKGDLEVRNSQYRDTTFMLYGNCLSESMEDSAGSVDLHTFSHYCRP